MRRRHTGEIVALSICADCKNGFLENIYYGKGRPLCRDCWHLTSGETKDNQDQDRVLQAMGGGEWVIPMLARTCKLTQSATEQALRDLVTAGKVERRGRAWARVNQEDRR